MSSYKPLTSRQSIFCQQIQAGKSATEACKLAGYGPSAPTHSTAMLKSAKIQQYLHALQAQATSAPGIMTLEERLQRLSELAKRNHVTNPVQAIAEINRMQGVYPAEKHQHQVVVIEVTYGGRASVESAQSTQLPVGESENQGTDSS